ncbi:hypothetical protein AB0L74_34460 [Streptomyces sp. NPDC052020]|uniref:hypothetical protein n=1 Tax=Streptomyces sp. NPDC052020 TaxID=3155677 RepID=UPI00341E42A6
MIVKDRIASSTARGPPRRYDGRDFTGVQGTISGVLQVDGAGVQQTFVQGFQPAVDGFAAAVLDEPFEQACDSADALAEILGYRARAQRTGAGVEQTQRVLNSGFRRGCRARRIGLPRLLVKGGAIIGGSPRRKAITS